MNSGRRFGLKAGIASAAGSRWAHQVVAFAIVVSVALAFHRWGSSHLPRGRLIAGDLAYGSAFAGWALALVFYWRSVARGTGPDHAWYAYLLTILWLFSLLGSVLFWIQVPYADPDRRIVSMLICSVLIAASAIVTVRPPSFGAKSLGATLVPMVLPATVLAYYFGHRDAQLGQIAPLLVLFCALMLALREFLQRQLDMAHAAMIEAQAQRDVQRTAKERFMASASHDLEQPLQAARLSFEQALETSSAAERQIAVRRVDWAFDAIAAMITQITQHLKLEAGAVVARHEATPLGPVIARVVGLNEPAARLAGVALRTLPTQLAALGDPALIERVLGNFVGNALRHAGAQQVLVGARRAGGLVRLWVIDDGGGIAAADQATLFDDYAQGDHHGEIRGGYGLGLGSARRMALLMQGQAGHDPRWTGGSAFFLELPAG